MSEFNNYRRNLVVGKDKNFFVLPWANILIKNCSSDGDFLSFSTIKEYKEQGQSLWLLLKLQFFRDNSGLYTVLVCPECDSMKSVGDFCLEQPRNDIEQLRCIHSKAAEYLLGNYDDHWILPPPSDDDEMHNISINDDVSAQCLIDQIDECFLGAYQIEGKVSVLFTVSQKQKVPFCTNCSSKKCKCFFKYKNKIRGNDNDSCESNEEFHWERRKTQRANPRDDYREILDLNEHYKRYGYNLTPFEYPIKRDPDLQEKLVNRMKGQFNIPGSLRPDFVAALVCKDGFGFDDSEDRLVQTSTNLIIYTNTHDILTDSITLARPTTPIGSCRCLHQFDGHEILLWNLGRGRMVDYCFLHSSVHQIVDGTPMNSIYQSRLRTLASLGIDSTFSYEDFERACSGYVGMIRFRKDDFICNNCGQTPKYIVADGKMTAPTLRKVKHLSELDHHEDDEQILLQGSHFKDRVFLYIKRERKLVQELLTDDLEYDAFVHSDVLQSENSRLLIPLLQRLQESWPDEIPPPYKRFICNLCKPTSVASYMQVTHDEPLAILQSFCNRVMNLRSTQHQHQLQLIAEELPAIWPNLMDIMEIECSEFLPPDMSNIILQMIYIRRKTFENAAQRNDDDYTSWPSPEDDHPTQCYPAWPIFRYPKKYDVNSRVDSDFCAKSFDSKKGFAFGVFSVGCSCPANITYGWEMMLSRESAHNLFRLLMCRNLNMETLEGVIFDFACGLDPYLLNR